jgi:hypothetical protein
MFNCSVICVTQIWNVFTQCKNLFPHTASEEDSARLTKVQSRLTLTFSHQLLQNGVSLRFEPVKFWISTSRPWDMQAVIFQKNRTIHLKSAVVATFAERTTGSRRTIKHVSTVTHKTKKYIEKSPLLVLMHKTTQNPRASKSLTTLATDWHNGMMLPGYRGTVA